MEEFGILKSKISESIQNFPLKVKKYVRLFSFEYFLQIYLEINQKYTALHSIRYNTFLVKEDSFDHKTSTLRDLSSCRLVISFRLASYMHAVQEASNVLGFHTTPQILLNFDCITLYSITHSPHPSLSPLAPVPLNFHIYLFSSPFLWRLFASTSTFRYLMSMV